MSDFLIYAARLQDAGVTTLWVSLGSNKEGTRLMHVSPDSTDISLLWNYDTDPLYPRGESYDAAGPNAWQGALIAAANQRLAAMGY